MLRDQKKFETGFSDKLEPLKSLDLSKAKTIDGLVSQMKHTSFGGRKVGEAADVLEEMVKDKKCFNVLTLSGAMTVAKMGLVICDMIDSGMVDAVVSTGALMAHGFIETAGMTHFKYEWEMNDEVLFEKGYDRVYDTLELEKNLDDAELIVREVYRGMEGNYDEVGSYTINRELGKYLEEKIEGRGTMKSAYKKNVPVYIPAFTDSEFGLDFALYVKRRLKEGKKPLRFNPILDLEHYTKKVMEADRIGIFTIGGGVPRNWAQQIGPYLEIMATRGVVEKGTEKRFKYAVRICPEPSHWGGLSGCTYSEGVSWGKFVPKSEGGRQVEVYADATIAWPLVVGAVLERLKKG